jgi:drug/metabolite transporter (DMT)-like permease
MGYAGRLRDLAEPSAMLRTVCEGIGTFAYMASLAHIPIATALSIHMATPLFVLPLARVILGERASGIQIFAIFVGLVGVLFVLRPDSGHVDGWLLLSLSSAVFFALRDTLTRRLSSGLPSLVVMFAGISAGACAGGVDLAVRGWSDVGPIVVVSIVGSAVFVGVGMLLLIWSVRVGEVSVVSPFRYSAIIWAVLAGYLVWGTLPDGPTVAGVVLICVGGFVAIKWGTVNATSRARKASG